MDTDESLREEQSPRRPARRGFRDGLLTAETALCAETFSVLVYLASLVPYDS